jgi:ABC-2 type transport system permease protein
VRLRSRPGSWRWLLAHELRLLWRLTGSTRSKTFIVLGLVIFAAAHLAGYVLMAMADIDVLLRAAPVPVILFSALVLLLVLSASFGLAVSAMFDRGDLDLLMSSPVPFASVYAVRGIAVALGSVATVGVFWLPMAHMGPFHGRWGTLASYPALVAIGLACAAISLAATLLLVRLLGVRRARVTAQVLGAVVGASLILGMQAEAILPRSTRVALREWASSNAVMDWLGPQSLLAWPVRAVFGDPVPLLAVVALGVGLFVLAIRTTGAAFAAAVQAAPRPASGRGAQRAADRPFRSGLARIVIAKELTLIARDPSLIAKSLLQILYLVPIFLILLRRSDLASVMGASLVMLASALAGTLAYITVSGEEAPDLLGAAPVADERLRWLKVAAALLPVGVILLPFLAWFASRSLEMLAILLAFLGAALASSAVVQVWGGTPGTGRDLKMRARHNVLANLIEGFSNLGWAAGCYLAMSGMPRAAVAAATAGALGPTAAWLAGRRRRHEA